MHETVQYFCMIDPRLHVLRVVAARGTVTAAAHDLNYTPSAVSHQLRGLARELGVTLLEPDGRGVRLTIAARILLERSDELYARWEEIHAEVSEADPEPGGALRLCGFSTAAAALLPSVAARVRADHPHCTVRIIEADPTECFDLLLADQADLAVVVAVPGLPSTTDARFEQESVLDDPLDLLVPVDHPVAHQSSVSLREAADESWILDRPGSTFHHLTQAACAAAGFSPFVAHEAVEWETGAALVDAGLGVSLVPRLAQLPGGYRIIRVPLRGDPSPARHIRSSIRRGSRRQPVVATALAALGEAARRNASSPRAPAG